MRVNRSHLNGHVRPGSSDRLVPKTKKVAMETERYEAEQSERIALARLALRIADREERLGAEPRKTEVVLADAGFSLTEIARLVNRNYDTVKTTVRRARERAHANGGSRRRAAEKAEA